MPGDEISASAVLLRRARDGSGEALGALFEACGARLLALIRLRLGGSLRRDLESRDILQATFLKAFEHLEQFEGSGSRTLMAWLAAIARNEIRDRAQYLGRQRRDAGARVSLHSSLPVAETVSSHVSRLQIKADTRLLEQALADLSDDHREVIVLRQFEELSFREIGERLGRSEDAARMLFARALAALTVKMKQLKA
jgi:RNA polymerase sigma-70 factor, ECF subfamily